MRGSRVRVRRCSLIWCRHSYDNRARFHTCAKSLLSLSRSSVEFVARRPAELDVHVATLGRIGEWRAVGVAQHHAAEDARPLTGVLGRDDAHLEQSVVGRRNGERDDAAGQDAELTQEHTAGVTAELLLPVNLDAHIARLHSRGTRTGPHVRETSEVIFETVVGEVHHGGVKAHARHHGEPLTVEDADVQPSIDPAHPTSTASTGSWVSRGSSRANWRYQPAGSRA